MQLLRVWPETTRPRRTPQPFLKVRREDIIAAARITTDLTRTDWREHYAKVEL